jgi:hypothetical protein
VLRTPPFVDRMELPDDAEGRIVIFTVGDSPQAAPSPSLPGRRRLGRAGDRVAAGLDSRYVAPALAAVLVLLLLLGLLLKR